MNQSISKVLVAAIFAITVSLQAEANVHSKAIVVEFPSDLPELAQVPSQAMYLHHTGTGQVILYLEQNQGQRLAILDVTDPANIKAVGQVSVDATAPYDFAQDLADSAILIHYRNHSGFAVISFKDYKQPVLRAEPEYLHPASVEAYGSSAVLLVSSNKNNAQTQSPQYEILSISNPANPTPLATIKGVTQRLDRPATGTVFIMNNNGLTVVRCLAKENEHHLELQQKDEN
jgi:hypothetical protein